MESQELLDEEHYTATLIIEQSGIGLTQRDWQEKNDSRR